MRRPEPLVFFGLLELPWRFSGASIRSNPAFGLFVLGPLNLCCTFCTCSRCTEAADALYDIVAGSLLPVLPTMPPGPGSRSLLHAL